MDASQCANDQGDWANVAEEIEPLGRSDRCALRGRSTTNLEHLIKQQVSPASKPRAGWRDTGIRERRKLELVLDAARCLNDD